MIKKVLIPNRGEIAVRIIMAAHDLGIKTVVTLSELEKDTLPAQISDEVHFFPDGPFSENYLSIPLIIDLAKKYNANGIHPGYGFLAENHLLVEACEANKIIFIGPSAENLKQMGDKQMARSIAQKARVPLTPSWEGSIEDILAQSSEMTFPILIKAAMGGGGKGMVICNNHTELSEQLPAVARQAERYFGDGRIYAERYLNSPRHIEVQVLADSMGQTIHLFERECSVQRRFQKVIEEAPAPNLSPEKQNEFCNDALKLCKAINYKSAGTLEFLLDEDGKHYFLEMNTRIQVEHCVTEEITGIDLVKWQFKIANGEQLNIAQNDISIRGHSIEARVYAEKPDDNFQPSPGDITYINWPSQNEFRLEAGFNQPATIHPQFDPMIAKIIVHQASREEAIKQLKSKLNQTVLLGISTNLLYLNNVLEHPLFLEAKVNTHFCELEHIKLLEQKSNLKNLASLSYALLRFNPENGIDGFWRIHPYINYTFDGEHITASYTKEGHGINSLRNMETSFVQNLIIEDHYLRYELEGDIIEAFHFSDNEKFEIIINNQAHHIIASDILPAYQADKTKETNSQGKVLKAPLPGQVMKILVNEGQGVKKGDALIILEAMKMENHLNAWKDGIIEQIHITNGEKVKSNQLLITTN